MSLIIPHTSERTDCNCSNKINRLPAGMVSKVRAARQSASSLPCIVTTVILMFFPLKFRFLFACCCIALLPAQSLFGSLVISSTPGVTHEADGFSTIATTSAELVGLEIMVYFADGSSDLGIWTANGITQNNWSVTQGTNQSTFTFPFSVTNNTGVNLTRFSFHGAGSTTIFDRSILPGTAGTARGRDVEEFTTLRFSQDIEAVYFDQVQVVGSTPQGDLFAGLDISFSSGISGNNGLFQFRTDRFETASEKVLRMAQIILLLKRRQG